jgi:signal transduction histidine kinase
MSNLQSAPLDNLQPFATSSDRKVACDMSSLRMSFFDSTVIKSDGLFKAAAITREARTKQALAEYVALKSEATNKAKSDFLTHMVHEIRTPLGAIIGLSNKLHTAPLDDQQKHCLKVLQDCAEGLMKMIDGSLDVARIESHSIEPDNAPFNIYALLQHIVSAMSVKAEEKHIDLALVFSPEVSKIFVGDCGRIQQIVMNLVGNAIKFTETGGVIVSCTGREDKGRSFIDIAVTDTGIGIVRNKIDAVFGRFVQADSSIPTKFGGSGLGLFISKALAESMRGTLTVTSVVGKGSIFTLHLDSDGMRSNV